MSGAMWFLVVVVVSVVVSGSVGVILNAFLGDSKESEREGVRGLGGITEVKPSRDENEQDEAGGYVLFQGGVVNREYFKGYLNGHRDGSGSNNDALGIMALQQRLRRENARHAR